MVEAQEVHSLVEMDREPTLSEATLSLAAALLHRSVPLSAQLPQHSLRLHSAYQVLVIVLFLRLSLPLVAAVHAVGKNHLHLWH